MDAPSVGDVTWAVEANGVAVRRGGRWLLNGIDLRVASGSISAIVGPNGSGKSTLLRVLAALERPDRGDARVGGWSVLEQPTRVRRTIGYVGDQPGLAEKLTVLEQLDFAAAQRGIADADAGAAALAMVELVDLVAVAREPSERLSRGERQRLAIALALVHDPSILILDEPLSGVDDAGRAELVAVFAELRELGKTLVIAGQSETTITGVADVVTRIERGKTVSERESTGRPAELTWLEVLGDVPPAVSALLEMPSVSELKVEGSLITLRLNGDELGRAAVAESLIRRGVKLAGFGTMAGEGGQP